MPSLEYCKKRLTASRAYREQKDFFNRWKRCYNYYIGNVWKSTLPAEHPRIQMNICLNFVESLVSSLLTQAPQAYIVPLRDNAEDGPICESLTGAFAHWADITNYQRALRLGSRNRFIYGTNHFKVRWDGLANGEMGEVKVEAVSPFCIFHDPHATSLDDCEFVIQGSFVSTDRIKRLGEMTLPAQQQVSSQMTPLETHPEGSAIVYEGWFEGGETVVWFTDEKIIGQGKNDYWHGQLPFIRDPDTEIPDEYEGMGIIEPIMSLQREINETRSQRLIYSRFHTYPWTILDTGAIKNPERLTNEPNLILQKERGTEIKREYAPPMPAHLMSMPESTMSAAERVLGIAETPQGRRPSSVTSGRGMEVVAQFQGQRIEGTKARPLEQVIKETAVQVISLMQQFYKGERVVNYWQGGEMMSAYLPDEFPLIPFKVRIEPGTTLAVNKVARSQEAMTLAQMGKITDSYLFRALELPGWREMMRERQMEMEAMQMAQQGEIGGQPGMPGLTAPGMPAINPTEPVGGVGNPLSQMSNLPMQAMRGSMGRKMGMRSY